MKKTWMKRISIVLAALLLLAVLPIGVFNDDKFDHTYWYTFTAYGNELLDDSRCFD